MWFFFNVMPLSLHPHLSLYSSSLGSQWTRQPCPGTSSSLDTFTFHALFTLSATLLFCSSTKTWCLFSQSHSQILPTEEVESGNDIHYRLHWSSCWEWLLAAAGLASYPGLFFFNWWTAWVRGYSWTGVGMRLCNTVQSWWRSMHDCWLDQCSYISRIS